jgi:hypothetical protein
MDAESMLELKGKSPRAAGGAHLDQGSCLDVEVGVVDFQEAVLLLPWMKHRVLRRMAMPSEHGAFGVCATP